MLLEQINQPNDIKKLKAAQLPELAGEIRAFLIDSVSRTGGHLASNLGVVELTIALHRVLTFPQDKLIWDVGHQAYTHKILTGRRERFDTLRCYGGLSGFPKREESDCDAFDTGHSTTSLSAGLGYVKARDLQKQNYKVFAVIGDGSLTGGMAFEALNNAAMLRTNYVMVLNDNNMSISRNVGGMSKYLGNIRTAEAYTGLKDGVTKALSKMPGGEHMVTTIRKTKSSIKQLVIPGMLFENLGITYLGPVDGHDIRQMTKAFREAARVKGPVLVHVITEKGRGYEPAQDHPERFHGVGAFDAETGVLPKGVMSYTDVFSRALKKYAEDHPQVVAVSAAMPIGTGLNNFARSFPDRFFDVGIAEQHAVTFAAGLACGGLVPVVAIYSSFLQRAYDQILEDVCMQNLHVVFAVDRAGLVGSDGETHQGGFDLSFLAMIPGIQILAPKNKWELGAMLTYAIETDGPVALRYPRGAAYDGLRTQQEPIIKGKAEVLINGRDVVLLAIGSMVEVAMEAAEILKASDLHPTVVNMRFAKPLDTELLQQLTAGHGLFFTLEDNVLAGGMGEWCSEFLHSIAAEVKVIHAALPDHFVHQGTIPELRHELGMDAEAVAARVIREMKGR